MISGSVDFFFFASITCLERFWPFCLRVEFFSALAGVFETRVDLLSRETGDSTKVLFSLSEN